MNRAGVEISFVANKKIIVPKTEQTPNALQKNSSQNKRILVLPMRESKVEIYSILTPLTRI